MPALYVYPCYKLRVQDIKRNVRVKVYIPDIS